MLDRVTIAAVALDSAPGRTAENLDKIAAWCGRAAERGARLVLFPELSVTGFFPNHPVGDHAAWLGETLGAARRLAEPLDGPAVRRLERIAADARVYVAAGLLEDAGSLLFNTHVLIGPDGVVGVWRKMHVPLFEMQIYNGGPGVETVETPLGRVGVNICFDAFLPESTRLLAVGNAEIVLFPFAADPPPATADGWAAWAGPVLRARCQENAVFGVAVNYSGEVELAGARQRFPGGGMVVGPSGAAIHEWDGPTGEPHMMLAQLDRAALTAARAAFEYTLRFRRPELYGPLVRP